jgi:hypothetical protein
MRPSNPLRNVALCKNLESVAIAPQLLEEIRQREAATRCCAYLLNGPSGYSRIRPRGHAETSGCEGLCPDADQQYWDLSPSAAYSGGFQGANKIGRLASQLILRRKKVADLLSYACISTNPLFLDFLKP